MAKHRGMTNAYLKGDHSFKQAILTLQTDIDRVFDNLTAAPKNTASLNNEAVYQHMQREWAELKSHALEREPENNFKLHIAHIEKVIENISEEGLFIETALSGNPNTKIITNILIMDLPHFVEILGQARGIGTGAIAQGGCSVSIKMNLKFLNDELESMVKSLETLKQVNTKNISNDLNLTSLVSDSISHIQSFSALLKKNVLDVKTPSITTEKLYNQGTEAISQSLNLFDCLYPLCLARINIQIPKN